MHGLQIYTQWPTQPPAHSVLLWALLPTHSPPDAAAQEWQWRGAQALQMPGTCAIHMLYGNAAQQAAQLAPWAPAPAASTPHDGADCRECLDAASEQQLFRHLLQRSTA